MMIPLKHWLCPEESIFPVRTAGGEKKGTQNPKLTGALKTGPNAWPEEGGVRK